MRLIHYILLLLTITLVISSEFTIARIKYSGGGDWYSDKSSLPSVSINSILKLYAEDAIILVLDLLIIFNVNCSINRY